MLLKVSINIAKKWKPSTFIYEKPRTSLKGFLISYIISRKFLPVVELYRDVEGYFLLNYLCAQYKVTIMNERFNIDESLNIC